MVSTVDSRSFPSKSELSLDMFSESIYIAINALSERVDAKLDILLARTVVWENSVCLNSAPRSSVSSPPKDFLRALSERVDAKLDILLARTVVWENALCLHSSPKASVPSPHYGAVESGDLAGHTLHSAAKTYSASRSWEVGLSFSQAVLPRSDELPDICKLEKSVAIKARFSKEKRIDDGLESRPSSRAQAPNMRITMLSSECSSEPLPPEIQIFDDNEDEDFSKSQSLAKSVYSGLSVDNAEIPDTIGLLERAAEIKRLQAERKNYSVELIFDLVEVVSKIVVFIKLAGEGRQATTLLVSGLLISIGTIIAIGSAMWRVRQLQSMAFLVKNGYSKHWRSIDRLVGSGKVDPRVENDSAQRDLHHLKIRSAQAFLVDFPWVLWCVLRNYIERDSDILMLLSIALAGYGFGIKYACFSILLENLFCSSDPKKKKLVFQSLPADVKIGTGTSTEEDVAVGITRAFDECCSMLGCKPTFMVVLMNATRDHERGLTKLVELAPEIPFVGGTTCQGVMTNQQSLRRDEVVAIWGLFDSEGSYAPRIWCHGDGEDSEAIEKQAAKIARRVFKMHANNNGERPSFAFLMSCPGSEDRVLTGFARGAPKWSVPVVGGTSADNDITGQWKQWSSVTDKEGYQIESNGCAVCFVWCSAVVQSNLFTGYSATGKAGEITKTKGPRHILEIDNRPASIVYNEWAGGEWSRFLAGSEDSNILGPSALYPFGQICGEDKAGDPVFRSMHPHQLVKRTNSVTLLSDVKVGERVCMMTGSKENLINRVAGVATHIVNVGEFSLQEVRGCLVVFCAGCMMYCSESMDLACQKLSKAIGGAPYIGMHCFGEQGQFPDGHNRHGNLMFSSLVFSSKRRHARLLNVDSGEEINEGDPRFEEVFLTATICE